MFVIKELPDLCSSSLDQESLQPLQIKKGEEEQNPKETLPGSSETEVSGEDEDDNLSVFGSKTEDSDEDWRKTRKRQSESQQKCQAWHNFCFWLNVKRTQEGKRQQAAPLADWSLQWEQAQLCAKKDIGGKSVLYLLRPELTN
ncbi:hypothetical protein AMECASPLE_004509 [Ameca splendens]|uniref:Uncharacterized protein n=1 Tax=Ameca splendens TaxID=208324 RepID=A0ABV0Z8X0_9TELE